MSAPERLQFGNDMSRLVRGIAIVLMVCNHAMPGHIIGFAVPLFSFLVGYGYWFSRSKGLGHSLHRVWHLLSHFWLILLGICLPTALLTWNGHVSAQDVVLNMFGLSPVLNFYCWYVYFYIFAMGVMPFCSRAMDRHGLWAAVSIIVLSTAVALITDGIMAQVTDETAKRYLGILYRCTRYLPIVAAGYWLAANGIFSKKGYTGHGQPCRCAWPCWR